MDAIVLYGFFRRSLPVNSFRKKKGERLCGIPGKFILLRKKPWELCRQGSEYLVSSKQPKPRNMRSETRSPQPGNGMAIIGWILLVIPVIIWSLWIHVFNSNPSASQAEKQKMFTSYFPAFLRSLSSISLVVLLAAAASIIFSAAGRRQATRTFRVLGVVAIVFAAIILLFQLFTML